jgi:glycerol-3-phosphate dehydrogenase
VVDKSFLPGDTAIMVPRTDDGRVLFAVPWHNKIVLGTTDTSVSEITDEPVPLKEEVEFILTHIARYLTRDPQPGEIKSMFAGLRPLVKRKTKTTAALARDHLVTIGDSGLITITGGKWTTYRKMAEDVVDLALTRSGSEKRNCITSELKLSGHDKPALPADVSSLNDEEIKILVGHAVADEMCMTVEDFLSRRTRLLLLDAAAAIDIAPKVARLMAEEMHKDESWIQEQINNFNSVAGNYLPHH